MRLMTTCDRGKGFSSLTAFAPAHHGEAQHPPA